jgi:hypothetical protein
LLPANKQEEGNGEAHGERAVRRRARSSKTKKVKPDEEIAEGEGEERRSSPRERRSACSARRASAKVTAEVIYTPTGGQPSTQGAKLKLTKRR